MFYYIIDASFVAPVAICTGINGYIRAKYLRDSLKEFDPANCFKICLTRYEYMWAIQAEEKSKYFDIPSYYVFETWDEAAEFGNETYSVFDTDCDIIELNMLGD